MSKKEEPTLEEFAADAEQDKALSDLKRVNLGLMRKLAEAKASKEDLVDAVYRAAGDAATIMAIKPVPAPVKAKSSTKAETMVILASDFQTGKKTPNYDSEVAAQRVKLYGEKALKLLEIQRKDHPVNDGVLALLGDLVEGEDIFPGQEWRIDASLYAQIFHTSEIVVNLIRYLLTELTKINVVCVDGNHGRIGRPGQYHPETNTDRMVYRIAQMLLKDEKRVTWNFVDPQGERNWYTIIEVGQWRALAVHGDQFKGGFAGLPWYSFSKKINSWAAGAIREPFGDVLMGHWHQSAKIPLNTRNVYVNGSTESYNTWSQELLGNMSDPSQTLLFVDPVKGRVTANYEVHLT